MSYILFGCFAVHFQINMLPRYFNNTFNFKAQTKSTQTTESNRCTIPRLKDDTLQKVYKVLAFGLPHGNSTRESR